MVTLIPLSLTAISFPPPLSPDLSHLLHEIQHCYHPTPHILTDSTTGQSKQSHSPPPTLSLLNITGPSNQSVSISFPQSASSNPCTSKLAQKSSAVAANTRRPGVEISPIEPPPNTPFVVRYSAASCLESVGSEFTVTIVQRCTVLRVY